jgi:zinc transport system substrate-binding protein
MNGPNLLYENRNCSCYYEAVTSADTSAITSGQTRRGRRWPVAVATAAVLTLSACSGSSDAADTSPAQTSPIDDGANGAADSSPLELVTSFYPLTFVVERVGGRFVEVSNLTPAGTEPHDLELTPQDVASLHEADLVVYLSGFTPALDDAVADVGPARAFDVSPAARLDLDLSEHADEGDEHEHDGVDPHFWLDPTRLADVADAVAARLADVDMVNATAYAESAAALRGELAALDAEFEAGLASCANRNVVTSHTAFGYLAQRYGLTQVGISGQSPNEEPSPARLAEVTEFVREHDVTTIYYETMVNPAIADTVANETGASTAVLDPIEGLTEQSAGADYFGVMRANLQSLRAGQHCT